MPQAASLDALCIDTIRFLAADAVQAANSGHPGLPMGAAPMAWVLWDRFLKHHPEEPGWWDRDRFVLSAGHGSMLLYALLHLTGYALPLDELRSFRQWGSRTPGHPEHGETPGVETTTGPLGQGFGNAVGLAVAERHLAARYNRPGHAVIDHCTYVLASDGDMQEGVSGEAASLAGHLGLGKLVCLYDDNKVQIEGPTSLAFSEDVGARFRAYGWHVQGPIDGNDLAAVEDALHAARAVTDKPSLIVARTVIGYGSPVAGTAKAHGEPLGEDGVAAAKDTLGWPREPKFLVPDAALAHARRAVERGRAASLAWRERFAAYEAAWPELAAELSARLRGELPPGWDAGLEGLFQQSDKPSATRVSSGKALNALAARVPALMGGSADLAPSTKTIMDGRGHFQRDTPEGANLHFGVREHAMGAIASGLALHGGFIPYTATFLTFADYMRPPMRLACLMGLHAVYVFTHDSIGLGEDGPTHQPVEQLMQLRAMPNMTVLRPADAAETAEAWRVAMAHRRGPVALVLTRQNLPMLPRERAPATLTARGAYVLWQAGEGEPEVILVGTGSEVQLALAAGRALAQDGVNARVVSMPSWELFAAQEPAYRESVFPPSCARRVSVEAGTTFGWERVVGTSGASVGVDRYGASAPAEIVYEKLGVTAAAVEQAARGLLTA